jgi:hypothetical protein
MSDRKVHSGIDYQLLTRYGMDRDIVFETDTASSDWKKDKEMSNVSSLSFFGIMNVNDDNNTAIE